MKQQRVESFEELPDCERLKALEQFKAWLMDHYPVGGLILGTLDEVQAESLADYNRRLRDQEQLAASRDEALADDDLEAARERMRDANLSNLNGGRK